MPKTRWKLIHTARNYEISGLSTVEAVGFLAGFAEPERNLWLVKKDGQKKEATDWVQSNECRELAITPETATWSFHLITAAVAIATPPPTPPPPPKPLSRGSDRRTHERISARFRVVVISGNKAFRTYTTNASRGGLLLEKKVPWSLPGTMCQVHITNETTDENIEFHAKILSDSENPFRIAFDGGEEIFQSKLEQWIRDAQGKYKKAA